MDFSHHRRNYLSFDAWRLHHPAFASKTIDDNFKHRNTVNHPLVKRKILTGLMFHQLEHRDFLFFHIMDEKSPAVSDNAFEGISVLAGDVSCDQAVFTIHFKSDRAVLLQRRNFPAFPGTVKINHQLIVEI